MTRWGAVACVLAVVLGAGRLARADVTWKVATVHGMNQFSISPDGSTLTYDPQPRNTSGWYWYNNNGSPPGTLATGGFGPNGWRDGSRTFAVTDVAVGQQLDTLKLVFDYKHSLGGYTTINFFLTDGAGKYGIFAPTSNGIQTVGQTQVLDADWSRMTIDLTSATIPDTADMAVYEHNGLSTTKVEPYTTMQWGDIKDLYIAGMYDYQRSPAIGWGYWGTMFDEINIAGNATVVNGYGVALIWGDTVGNTTYTQQSRAIRNVVVSFGGTDYQGIFESAQLPAPGAVVLGMIGFGLVGWVKRRFA